jgi:calcineurin-like phosphoesterase family protein
MNNWFSSDPHYHHKNILKFTGRPYETVEDMNEAFIEWNNRNVKDTDFVWNLGDFSFGNTEKTIEVLSRLKGQQHLILGNHDNAIFNERKKYLDQGLFKSIQHYRELRFDNKVKIVMSHYPMRSWNGSNRGAFQLFGHVHGKMAPLGKSVDVGVDSQWITGKYEGRPFHLDEIITFMDSKDIVTDYGD